MVSFFFTEARYRKKTRKTHNFTKMLVFLDGGILL